MHMRMMIAGSLLSLAACGETNSTLDRTIEVYKDAGSTQCEDDGQSLEAMQKELIDAQIPVAEAACGTDGKMYTAMCGAPDGKIGIFTIDPSDLPPARALGFEALANVPDASRVPCSDW